MADEINPTRTKIETDSINYYLTKTKEKEITNFNEGSIARTLVESTSIEPTRIYNSLNNILNETTVQTATNQHLNNLGEEFGIDRLDAQPSSGTVTITPPYNFSQYNVPVGTIITSDEGFEYYTLDTISFDDQSDHTPQTVRVQSVNSGVIYNLPANRLFQMALPYNKIENNFEFIGGTDTETDEKYRERILNNRNAYNFATYPWIRKEVLKMDGVTDCIVEPNQVKVTIDNEEVLTTQILISIPSKDQELLDNIDFHFNKPGSLIKPVGTCIKIQSCEIIDLSINQNNYYPYVAIYYRDDGTYNDNDTDFFTELKSKIYNLMKTFCNKLRIGENLYLKDLNGFFTILGIEGYVNLEYFQTTDPTPANQQYPDDLGSIKPPQYIKAEVTKTINNEEVVLPAWINFPAQDQIFWINLDTRARIPVWEHIFPPQE